MAVPRCVPASARRCVCVSESVPACAGVRLGTQPSVSRAQEVCCQDEANPGQGAQGRDKERRKGGRLGCLEKGSDKLWDTGE